MSQTQLQPKAPLIVSHSIPRASIVDDDSSWIKFLNRCEELAPEITDRNIGRHKNQPPKYKQYVLKKRIVFSVRHGHWVVTDRKTGERIAWGKDWDSRRARASAEKVRDVHVKQRCPNGNVL